MGKDCPGVLEGLSWFMGVLVYWEGLSWCNGRDCPGLSWCGVLGGAVLVL
jgi:hypothetical protein